MRKAMELCIVTQTTGEQLVHWLQARCVYKMCIVCVCYNETACCSRIYSRRLLGWSLGMCILVILSFE